jgi:hypothetical protein
MKTQVIKNVHVMESLSDPVAVELMSGAHKLTRKKARPTREAKPAKPTAPVARNVGVVESRPAKAIPAVNAPAAAKVAYLRGESPAGPTREQAAVEQIKTILRNTIGASATGASGVPSKNASAAEKLNFLRR